ncbi:hypothetical protein HDR58_05350 [bacterium]|nr:hypothetical protein [bacterium]
MLEGMYVDNIMMHSETRAYPVEPQITAGLIFGAHSLYRYSLRESSYPTLSIVDELSDGLGNILPPGHYELALSDERDFLILIQSKQAIAIIPVFKVEVDMSQYEQPRDDKALKLQKKKEKEIAQTNKKREKKGMPLISKEDDIYQEASIEYIPSGNYYLIKYEREDVRAWGAIKG